MPHSGWPEMALSATTLRSDSSFIQTPAPFGRPAATPLLVTVFCRTVLSSESLVMVMPSTVWPETLLPVIVQSDPVVRKMPSAADPRTVSSRIWSSLLFLTAIACWVTVPATLLSTTTSSSLPASSMMPLA